MKIHLCSDLHLEFGYQELPGGEVLVLAGDVAEARSISAHHHSTKLVSNSPNTAFRCSEFFKFELAKYQKVFYVMGNHEHYHNQLHKTINQLQSIIPPNVTILENQSEEYNGVLFIGATLWTNLNNNNPITAMTLKSGMNDYRVITMKNPTSSAYHKLTPFHTRTVHLETMSYFKKTLKENSDKRCVVITHHGPSRRSVDPKYTDDYHMNGGYVSDCDEFIESNPNIIHWVHGHIHDPISYDIGSTRVTANPRGYVGHEKTDVFDSQKFLEIDI